MELNCGIIPLMARYYFLFVDVCFHLYNVMFYMSVGRASTGFLQTCVSLNNNMHQIMVDLC